MYRTVDCSIWQDPWFVDLSPQAKCLFLHLFTNSRVTACGAMEISISQIAFETKISAKTIERDLLAFGEKIAWWPERNTIIVRNFYKHQRGQSSDNFTKAARKAMATLFDEAKAWLGYVYPELKEGIVSPIYTHPQPIPNPSPTQGDKETVTVTVTALATGAETETEEIPPSPKGDDLPAEFVEFWNRYPAGFGSKPKSLQAWRKVRREHAAIMTGLELWHLSERWQGGFVKAAELWLRDRLWENPAPPPKSNANAPNGRWSGAGKLVTEMTDSERMELRRIEDADRIAKGLTPVWSKHDGPTTATQPGS